jgi:hypothetical protein
MKSEGVKKMTEIEAIVWFAFFIGMFIGYMIKSFLADLEKILKRRKK